nr:retrovirus-related Pol polyprotein from transposon TNT 1-94 [Tanacetum cinerariifolium]
MSRSVPKGMSRLVPEGVSRSEPEGMSRSVPKGMIRPVPEGMSRLVPEGMSRSVPEGMSRLVHEGMKETYHFTFDESMEAIRFTNTLVDEIGINDSSRYPPDKFLHKDDPSRQYQANFDISYYITPHGRSLTKLTKDNHIPEVITLNKQNTPYTNDVKGPPDLVNTKETQEQNDQNDLINSQPTKETSGNNTKTLVPIAEPSDPEVPQS